MTRYEWHFLMGFWCGALDIAEAPNLLIVPASDIPGCDALCEYYDAVANGWTIKVREGAHTRASRVMCEECLHIKTGCTDQVHEVWIQHMADLLEASIRAKA